MKKVKKLKTIVIVSIFFGTIIGANLPIEKVKAINTEIPLDTNFITEVALALANVADKDNHWMGRAYGSPGEQFAADNILIPEWEENMGENTAEYNVEKERIDFNTLLDYVDKKFDITEKTYELWIDDVKVDTEDYQPIPCLLPRYQDISGEYTVIIPPWYWYINWKNIGQYFIDKMLKNNQMLYEFEYSLLNNAGGISGEVVYVEDYESASIEDTDGRIHLVEIEQNASDDVFNETVKKVSEFNGIGYIIMTTNPTFIDKTDTAIPGIAISQCDGEKLKDIIMKNNETIVEIEGDPIPQEGTLKIFYHSENPSSSNKYIYLIDADLCVSHGWELRNPTNLIKQILRLSFLPFGLPPADAFFYSDLTSSDAHLMSLGASLLTPDFRRYPDYTKFNMLWSWFPRPMISINGELKNHLKNYHEGDQVNIRIDSDVIQNAESYNVIGTVQGESEEQIIICGHYDSFWGQCPIDDAFGPAIAWSIAKYFKDNGITPKYTLKLIAWGGEEPVCRGSFFYVNQHIYHGTHDVVKAVINIDPVGMNNHSIPFTPWIYPGFDDNQQEYLNILEVMDPGKYMAITHNLFYYPHQYPANERRDKPAWGISDTDAFCAYEDPKNNPPLVDYMIQIERWPYENDFPYDNNPSFEELRGFFDHRTGGNFQEGDTWNKVDLTDVFCIANMVLNLTKKFLVDSETIFSEGCSFVPQDLDDDTKYDSVKIDFSAITDISSWCTLESRIYQNEQPCSTIFRTNRVDLPQGENTTSNLTVTLPANASAGDYDIRVYLKDNMGNQNDFENSTIYLYPYNNSIADFTWKRNENNLKMITFTDLSFPSPDAILASWNWSFGDGNYSEEQNCSHNYSSVGTFNVTLTVTDSANKTANVTKQVETFNTPPVADFLTESDIVVTNTSMTFSSHASDIDGIIVNTTWYFGDNTTGYGGEVYHEYTKSGFYSVSLMVTDNDNYTEYITIPDYVHVVDALVDDEFSDDPDAHLWNSITEAIDDAPDDGHIYVYTGRYDTIRISKSIHIYSEGDEVFIWSEDKVVDIGATNVTLNGFNISNGMIGIQINRCNRITIEDCALYNNEEVGILVDASSNCSIINCSIDRCDIGVKIINSSKHNIIRKSDISTGFYGVYMTGSSMNWIGSPSISNPYQTDCTFTHTRNAIYLNDSDYNFILGCDIDGTHTSSPWGVSSPSKGIYLNNSENNTISTCHIHDMTGKGIYLNDSTWNKIEHCKITWNPTGVDFYNSPENLITQNHFGGNSEFAIYLPSDTQYNHVYYNDFFANGDDTTNQSWDANGAKGAENLWNKDGNRTLTKEGRGEGNFWSDYTGDDNDQDGIGDTPYEISGYVERNDSYPVMEPYGWCNFTQDSTPPVITNVSAEPHTVGFGYNMTIRATVTDNSSNISLVKVNIIYPDQSTGNYTMDCISGSLYQFTFTNTWTVGQYNYTIWAMDETYSSNSSGGHHFHVSAQATISIATLQNSYSGSQYINITDPPNPPENYTLVDRGLTWDEYYHANTGLNTLEVSAGPINYQDENSTWMPINNTISLLASNHPAYVYGYRTGNNRGLFGAYFKSNAQNEWPVAYSYNRSDDPTIHAIRSKLVGVGYVDPQSNWAYQYLQNVQSSQGQVSDYSITYPDVFTGANVTWSYGNTGLKEEITMSNATKTVLQNHPPSQYGLNDTSSYLVFITKLDYQNLDLYNDSGVLDGNVTISDNGVEFRDMLSQFKCALPLGEAYELNNETARQQMTYRIIQFNGNTYLLSGLKVSDLNTMTYPVVIDPTLTVYSISSDGYIYKSGLSYSTVQSASTGTVDNSSSYLTIGQKKVALGPIYYVYRGFVFFNTSTLPSNAYLDNATLSLYKKDDYSTTDFNITIQNGQPTYPRNPMQSADYNKSYYSGNGGTLSTSGFTSGYNAIPMNNLSWINQTGITKLCLRSSRDISGTAPTGNEYVNVYSNEFIFSYPPKLVINYRNQSKIKNTGSTDIRGYLLIQVQYYDTGRRYCPEMDRRQ